MARNVQLLQLVLMLREEINRAPNVNVGVDDLPSLKNKLARVQETLYDEYDWPFLRQVFPYKPLSAGVQYYDFPTGLNVQRVERLDVWFGNLPRELERGISFEQYAVYNSNIGVTADPALRWDVRWTGSTEQFEIWPIPASNTAQNVQFIGIRNLRPLIADDDVADLDDQLIVLFAAAELLAKQGAQSAGEILKMAQARLLRMKGRIKGAEAPRRLGMGDHAGERKIKIVVRAS
jgi:hypothetical protein